MHMKKSNRSKSGQALTEYIIIVVIVALATIAVLAVFSDTLRQKFGGAALELGGDSSAVDSALSRGSHEYLRNLDQDGAE